MDNKTALSFFGRTVAFAALWVFALPVAWAQTVAYDAPLQLGNQAWTGNLGLDFNVSLPVLVSALGVFDAKGDGFTAGTTITVAILNRSTQAVVAGPVTFTNANPGTLVAGDRFQTLSPAVTLPVGEYSVVAVGFGSLDLNGNSTIGGYTASAENGGGAITFVGSGRYDANTTLDFPTIVPSPNPSNVFLAGTFKFTTAPPAASDTFLLGTDASAGMFPEAILVDKLNTPHASLAVANWGSANVSVLKGAGTGSFAAATNYAAGPYPRAIAVGDLCGHGRRDLAIANWGDGTVSILCNNGSGDFVPSSPPSFAAGPNPYGVSVGDFNGDNKPDLIIANDNIGVTLLLGNGNGTFQPPISAFDSLLAPSSITVADFNNDGKLDFAAANPTLGTVSVLLGNGDGTFKTPAISTPLAASSRPLFITSGKLKESSGNMDVAVADMLGTVWVLTGTGNGQFTKNGPYVVARYPNSIALGDLNGDGHLDLAVANMYGNVVSVLLGNGDGTLQQQVPFSSPTMGLPVSVALGVFAESSTSLDAAVASFYGPINILLGKKVTISVYSGNGQFAPRNTTFVQPAVAAVSAAQSGIPVQFAIVAGPGGASATFAGGATTVTALTDATGHAISPAFTANGIAGSFNIIATVGYGNSSISGATVKFTETN